jgi:hypothetical protein
LKIFLFVPFLLLLIFTPAFGALSDKTGLANRFDVETSGYTFEIKVVSNFDVTNHEFDKDEKRLTIFINSGLENNLGELIIPTRLLSGNFTFYLNDVLHNPIMKSNDKISFITLNFTGVGNNKIDIIATETFAGVPENSETIDDLKNDVVVDGGGGCLIATATYGSELSPQVQQLRELRDNTLLNTESGKLFMNSFNQFYYSFSPVIADLERENPVFKEAVKLFITPMVSSLSILNHVEMNSEESVLGYGISLIILNLAMYVGIPASVIIGLKKKF